MLSDGVRNHCVKKTDNKSRDINFHAVVVDVNISADGNSAEAFGR